jgi:two-component system, NtrC family, sensor kinase
MKTFESLLAYVEPLSPEHAISDVSERMLATGHDRFLCLPVVVEGKPVGSVSRARLQNIFMHRFGREIHGHKRVEDVMNASPIIVAVEQPVEEVSRYITDNIQSPVTEDFIVTRGGSYFGVGSVVDMLRAMESQVVERNRQLASAYRQLKASQTHLVQSEKMASLGQMVAGVAHEINTPLGYVKNNVVLTRDMYQSQAALLGAYNNLLAAFAEPEADPARVEALLANIQDLRTGFDETYPVDESAHLFDDTLYGIDQISDIVVNLKDFSRLDQAPEDSVDINACIDSALTIAKNVIKHKADVVRDYGVLPKIACCPSQINQVMLNLLTNAAHAIDGFGRIQITTQVAGDYVHVIVHDNGRGISEENQKKIFDPFFTTKPVGEGTGLGLSIAYKIVRDHQGAIRLVSKPGVGTKFCVSLPLQRKTQ